MKSLFSLRDNAMLLACLRKRFRPVSLITEVLLVLMAVAIVRTYIYYVHVWSYPLAGNWDITWYIVQGLFLLYGAVTLRKVLVGEAVSGTLNLHRVSPQPRLSQVVGLLLGGPSREWLLALLLSPIVVSSGCIRGISLIEATISQASLFLSTLALYTLLIVCVLHWDSPKIQSERTFSVTGGLVLIGFMAVTMLGTFIITQGFYRPLASYYTFTPYPLFQMLQRDNFRLAFVRAPQIKMHIAFAIQCVFQVPIIFLCIWAAIRKLRYPERPLFSKLQAFVATTIAFSIFLAEIIALSARNKLLLQSFAFFIVVVGTAGVYSVTPGRTLFKKHYLLCNRDGRNSIFRYALSDGVSNTYWLRGYVLLAGAFTVVVLFLTRNTFSEMLLTVVACLCVLAVVQVMCFAGMYEAFRLGPYHRNTHLFAILVALLWIAAPLLGFLMDSDIGAIFSPLAIPVVAIVGYTNLMRHSPSYQNTAFYGFIYATMMLVLVNAVLAGFFQYLAARCRRKLQL